MIDSTNNFKAYKAANTFEIDNTFNVYTNYLLWLVQKSESFSTKELLMQVDIIHAYVLSALKQNIKHSNDDNNRITIPKATATKQESSELASMLQKLDDVVISAVRTVTHSTFTQKVTRGLLVLTLATAALIGSGFIPQIPAALSITLWSLGAYFAITTAVLAYGVLTHHKTDTNVILLDKPFFDTPDLIKVQTDAASNAIDACTRKMLNAKTTDDQDVHYTEATTMTLHFAMKSRYIGRDDRGNAMLLSKKATDDQIISRKDILPDLFNNEMGLQYSIKVKL